MIKKLLAVLLLSSFGLQASPIAQDVDSCCHHPRPVIEQGLRNYAVFSNQAAVAGDGSNILFAPTLLGASETSSSGITIDDTTGIIRLPRHGIFFVEYTVRLNTTPFNGVSRAEVQLQQTIDNISTNIGQSSIIANTSVDGITDEVPLSQTQITGFALITVDGKSNRFLNLKVTLTGGGVTIPITSGQDANAQIAILQLN